DTGEGIVELARVEIRGDAHVVAEALCKDAVHPYAEFAPGRGNDAGLDLVAHHAEVGGRLVRLVEDADRHEEQAALEIDAIALPGADPGLLDLGLARVLGADDRVLDLDLRVQREALVESVIEPEHEARLVGGGVAALAELAVRGFTVADDVGRAV